MIYRNRLHLLLAMTLIGATGISSTWLAVTQAQGEAESAASTIAAYHEGVADSVHDFTDPRTGQIQACRACHVPHVQALRPAGLTATTQPAATTQPWGTSGPSGTSGPVATQPASVDNLDHSPAFDIYRIEGQRRVFVPGRYTPGPSSLLCLGCHDGTVATSIIGASHSMLAGVREGFALPDGFVWRDHPIGIPYSRDRREFRPMSFVVAKGLRLPEGRLECISCHDPHDEQGYPAMLIHSNRKSALCLTCHIK